jgi:hypothetical protein
MVPLKRLAELANGQLARGQQLEDATPHRITDDVERVHQALISVMTYISNG